MTSKLTEFVYDVGYFSNKNKRIEVKPRTIRNRLTAWELDQRYYDGNREDGYGGFIDDGRWVPLVDKLIKDFKIPNDGNIIDAE